VESLPLTELEEKVETDFSQEGEAKVCAQSTPNEQVHLEMEQREDEMLQLEALRKNLKLNHPLHKLKSKMIQLQMFVSLSVTKLI
jgi:hypothetical protein